jgi:uncharacterized protein YbjT (DUF2867 family)
MDPQNVVLTGGTGMVGGIALRACLERSDVARVTSIVRRPSGLAHPKLREVVHADFGDFGPLQGALEGQDAALFFLGVYTGQVSAAEFRRITVDFAQAFGAALRRHSPQATLCFMSAAGADPTETSRWMFARDKGAAEKALSALGFPRLTIFRPGYIYPVTPRREPNLSYRLTRALYPLIRRLGPNLGIDSDALALTMVEVGLHGLSGVVPAGRPLEKADIRALDAARRADRAR